MMPSSSWLHLSAVLSLVCLLNGDTRASPGLRAARIATFDRGTEGWRILPSLPSASEAGSENVTVSVSEANSPGYFLAPNEVVSQIRAAAAQTFGSGTASLPSTVVRVLLEVPETCWTASMGWRCRARLAIVGSRCSVHKTFALPERESPPTLFSALQLEADLALIDGEAWDYCSEILYPDGTCDEESVQSAMHSSLATLRYVIVAIDVRPTEAPPSDDGPNVRTIPRHKRDHPAPQRKHGQGRRHPTRRSAWMSEADYLAAGGRRRVGAGGGEGSSDCWDDRAWNVGYGGCEAYAGGGSNVGHCVEDGACGVCGCTCAQECEDQHGAAAATAAVLPNWRAAGECISYDWTDSEGDNCAAYAAYPAWCGFEDSSEQCCECGGGQQGGLGAAEVVIGLRSSSLAIAGAITWPPPPEQDAAEHGARAWLAMSDFPALAACSATPKAECPWSACDPGMQGVLAASCEGPYGTSEHYCWRQPFPVRYRMELVSFTLPADAQSGACYAAGSCIAPLLVERRNSTAASTAVTEKPTTPGQVQDSGAGATGGTGAGFELVSAERGGGSITPSHLSTDPCLQACTHAHTHTLTRARAHTHTHTCIGPSTCHSTASTCRRKSTTRTATRRRARSLRSVRPLAAACGTFRRVTWSVSSATLTITS